MTRRTTYTTYTALRIEAVRISTEVLDDDANPVNPRRRPGGGTRPVPTDTPRPVRRDERNRAIDWRDRP